MDRTAWISSELVSSLVTEGSLSSGDAATVLSCEVTPQGETGDHFASSVYIVNLKLDVGGVTNELNLVVKLEPENEFQREMLSTSALFLNEVVMYTEALPALREYLQSCQGRLSFALDDMFPICYKADADFRGYTVFVFENLKPEGFYLCENIFLDYEKCFVALEQIGRFHGLGYAYKKTNPEQFFSIIKKITDPRYNCSSPKPNPGMKLAAMRGISYVKSKVKEESMLNFLLKIEELVNDDAVAYMRNLLEPKDPLAVLCHGDFCRNNFFFRPGADNAMCYEMKMFDLQTARYASPSIDIAFFAFMSTSRDLREEHWDSLFQHYHSTVVDTLSRALDVTVESLGPEFSLQSFKKDFAKHAIYGYMLCSFFLPMMLAPKGELPNMEETAGMQPEDAVQFMVNLGGERMTQLLGDILRDIITMNTSSK